MPPRDRGLEAERRAGPPGDRLELRAVVGDDVLVRGDDRPCRRRARPRSVSVPARRRPSARRRRRSPGPPRGAPARRSAGPRGCPARAARSMSRTATPDRARGGRRRPCQACRTARACPRRPRRRPCPRRARRRAAVGRSRWRDRTRGRVGHGAVMVAERSRRPSRQTPRPGLTGGRGIRSPARARRLRSRLLAAATSSISPPTSSQIRTSLTLPDEAPADERP